MYQYSNNFPIDIFFANNTTSSFKIFERPIGLTRIWSFSHLFFPIPELSLHVQLFTPVSFDQLSNPLLLQPWNVDYLYARDPLLLPSPPPSFLSKWNFSFHEILLPLGLPQLVPWPLVSRPVMVYPIIIPGMHALVVRTSSREMEECKTSDTWAESLAGYCQETNMS